MSARIQLAQHLTTVLSRRTFTVVEAESLPDAITRCTVIVRFHNYSPASNAMGTLVAAFTVTLITPKPVGPAAENELDLRLPDVLSALRTVNGLVWTRASKVIAAEKYAGFDIDLTLPVDVSTN